MALMYLCGVDRVMAHSFPNDSQITEGEAKIISFSSTYWSNNTTLGPTSHLQQLNNGS